MNEEIEIKKHFTHSWITSGHSELWNCKSTYGEIPCKELPQINEYFSNLKWLDNISKELKSVIDNTCTLDSEDNQIDNIESIMKKANQLKLIIPESFTGIICNPELQRKIPTCTCCYLSLSKDFIPLEMFEDCYLLRFLNDSQCCVMWYLFLSAEFAPFVIASGFFLDTDIFDLMDYENKNKADLIFESKLCANTFDEFIYRFWIENTLWYSFKNRIILSNVQEEYKKQINFKLC